MDVVPGPWKVPPFFWLLPVFPTCQNALESLGRAGAVCPVASVCLGLGSPSDRTYVTPRQPRTSFFGGKGGSLNGENNDGLLG